MYEKRDSAFSDFYLKHEHTLLSFDDEEVLLFIKKAFNEGWLQRKLSMYRGEKDEDNQKHDTRRDTI